MNKKKLTMLTSLAVGGCLLFGTAMVNASQLSGYETYKAAVLDTKDLKNETAALKVSITDNGNALVDLSENLKQNESANALSSVTTVKSSDKTQTISFYQQDGKSIEKTGDSEVYLVSGSENKKLKIRDKADNPQIVKGVEVIVDTLVGSMKDGVAAADNGDGTKKVTISLNENQVTPLVNALASIALAKDNEMSRMSGKADVKDLKNVLPQLQSDVKVVSVDSTADINKNDIVTDQVAKVVVSGKDAAGTLHTIVINADLQLSNINSTTPDKVDLTGKQVKTMQDRFKGHRD